MKTELIITFLASLGIAYMNYKNKKKSVDIKKRMNDKVIQQQKIEAIKNSSYSDCKISKLIINLIEDSQFHEKIGSKLTDEEIKKIEYSLKLKLPFSYKLFLTYFGDGAYWLYSNSIDSINNFSWLTERHISLSNTIELNGEKMIKVKSLLCLMSEDSNGGAWCWLTNEKSEEGEFPLAYFNLENKKLYYKVANFTQWLEILIKSKSEVIRLLDKEEKLGLG